MPRYRIDKQAMRRKIEIATEAIEIGGSYFLSAFYDKDGATVLVRSKSTKRNKAGWNSSVEVQILEPLGGEHNSVYYKAGNIHTVNACNLYKNRADASHTAKFGANGEGALKLASALFGISTEKIAAICAKKAPAKTMNAAQKAWATRRARAAAL